MKNYYTTFITICIILLHIFCMSVFAVADNMQTTFDMNSYLALHKIDNEKGLNAFSNEYIPSDFFTCPRSYIDESEPNDTMATADVIYDNYNVYGRLGNNAGFGNEFDFYKLTLTTPGIVNFWISCDVENGLYNYIVLLVIIY